MSFLLCLSHVHCFQLVLMCSHACSLFDLLLFNPLFGPPFHCPLFFYLRFSVCVGTLFFSFVFFLFCVRVKKSVWRLARIVLVLPCSSFLRMLLAVVFVACLRSVVKDAGTFVQYDTQWRVVDCGVVECHLEMWSW